MVLLCKRKPGQLFLDLFAFIKNIVQEQRGEVEPKDNIDLNSEGTLITGTL